MSCHKNQISPSVFRPFYYCSVAGDLSVNVDYKLAEQHTLSAPLQLCVFLPVLPSSSFSSPHTSVTSTYLLYLSVHLLPSPQSFTLVYLSSGPEANMVHYIFNVVCNCLALSRCQEQIIFPKSSFMFGVQGSQSVLCECCTADSQQLGSPKSRNS